MQDPRNFHREANLADAIDIALDLVVMHAHVTTGDTRMRQPDAVLVTATNAKLFALGRADLASTFMKCFMEPDRDEKLRWIRVFVSQVALNPDFGNEPWIFKWPTVPAAKGSS